MLSEELLLHEEKIIVERKSKKYAKVLVMGYFKFPLLMSIIAIITGKTTKMRPIR
jgi:hypothetical protein